MKSVLISIQPKWCELIANGEKTVEVRKTRPRIDVPFKVYIYETQGRAETPFVDEDGHEIFKGRGQVIGEFVCEKITKAECGKYCTLSPSQTKVDALDLLEYADTKPVYGWHISDLVIYDDPKELSEFRLSEYRYGKIMLPPRNITRPPQSWCYVEERSFQ